MTTRILFAIGLSLLSAVVGGQTAPAVLPEALRAHVKDDRFDAVTSIRGFPLGVRSGLQSLFGSFELDIAEPGGKFQVTGTNVTSGLPIRRLVAGGCSTDHCFVHYERGGTAHTWHVALFHWTPAATKFEWGGIAPGQLATIDEIRKAVLSGAIKTSKEW
jgi:hypothetical protein